MAKMNPDSDVWKGTCCPQTDDAEYVCNERFELSESESRNKSDTKPAVNLELQGQVYWFKIAEDQWANHC